MRVFAGPNGSGKSTLRDLMLPEWVGVYLNPDELESQIRCEGGLDFQRYQVLPSLPRLQKFLLEAQLLKREGLAESTRQFVLQANRLDFSGVPANAYYASALADLIRRELVLDRKTFTFETVMSSGDKVEFMAHARSMGYRVYLYYIATEDPQINLSRVANRVAMGGHDVPERKVITRYGRSLDLLYDAIAQSHRAYIFDNSGDQQQRTWVAEVTEGTELVLRSDFIPDWFQRAVLDKF